MLAGPVALAAIFLLMAWPNVIACAQSQAAKMTAPELKLEEGRTILDDAVLADAQAQFEKCAHLEPKNALCLYGLARVSYYRVAAAEAHHDKHGVERWIDPGIAYAQHAIALNDGYAEAHSVLADLSAENQRAMALNPKSAVVQEALGREYMFKPKAFGGDINKSAEALQRAVQLDPSADEAWTWLSVALKKKGDQAGADQAIAKALALNPRSVFAQRVKAGDIKF